MKLRKTVIGGEQFEDDYVVRNEGRSIGRIRLANERSWQGDVWEWNITIPLPIPAWGSGTAATLFDAKADFKTAWDKFSADLTYEQVRRWHAAQDSRGADI